MVSYAGAASVNILWPGRSLKRSCDLREAKHNMRVTKVQGGTFMVGGQSLAHRAALEDAGKPGVYNLCKRGKKWELYYTASSASQPVLIIDGRIKEAMSALLDWHKTNSNCKNCVEAGGSSGWDLCAEAQELLAGS